MDTWTMKKRYVGLLPVSEAIASEMWQDDAVRSFITRGMEHTARKWAETTYPDQEVFSVTVTEQALGWYGQSFGLDTWINDPAKRGDLETVLGPLRAIRFEADVLLKIPAPIDKP